MMSTLRAMAFAAAFAASASGMAASAPAQGSAAPGTASLTGKLSMIFPPRIRVDVQGTVVWIPGIDVPPKAGEAPSMASRDKRFAPRILAVPTGTAVRFPNLDGIYHNAFSLSPGNAFDMGLYRKGAFKDTVLKNPGVVRVYCNIHPDMAASIVVVPGNAYAVVGADGSYRIDGIPPGSHRVHAWSDVAGETTATLEFEAGRATEWSPALDASRYQRSAHLNKHGKAYPKAKNDADRY